MKIPYITLVTLLIANLFLLAQASETKQQQLDKACELAHQEALIPRKKEIYQECITKFKKDEKVCEKEADAYNGNQINGAPLFYDLPECKKAFDFFKKQSQ